MMEATLESVRRPCDSFYGTNGPVRVGSFIHRLSVAPGVGRGQVAERLTPIRRERHREEDPRQQQEWQGDALDQRCQCVLAAQRKGGGIRQRCEDESDEREQEERHQGDGRR